VNSLLNRIILIGRLTRDPELRYTNTGKAVARFTLAIDRPFKNQAGEREADFINVVVWGPLADNCSKYLSKGKLAAVDGRLEIRSFEGQDGNRRLIAEVVAENVRFLSPRSQPEPGYNDGLDDFPTETGETGDLPF